MAYAINCVVYMRNIAVWRYLLSESIYMVLIYRYIQNNKIWEIIILVKACMHDMYQQVIVTIYSISHVSYQCHTYLIINLK